MSIQTHGGAAKLTVQGVSSAPDDLADLPEGPHVILTGSREAVRAAAKHFGEEVMLVRATGSGPARATELRAAAAMFKPSVGRLQHQVITRGQVRDECVAAGFHNAAALFKSGGYRDNHFRTDELSCGIVVEMLSALASEIEAAPQLPQMSHRGYHGSIVVDTAHDVLHGRLLGMQDLVTYESQTPAGLWVAFQEAVDEYLAEQM